MLGRHEGEPPSRIEVVGLDKGRLGVVGSVMLHRLAKVTACRADCSFHWSIVIVFGGLAISHPTAGPNQNEKRSNFYSDDNVAAVAGALASMAATPTPAAPEANAVEVAALTEKEKVCHCLVCVLTPFIQHAARLSTGDA